MATVVHIWPFRMSSSESGGNDGGGGQHLIRAGQELHVAAKSVGPSNYACPSLMKDAGDSFSEIGSVKKVLIFDISNYYFQIL